ncbi:MAG: hypothetical protein P4L40_22195 [Terracidiphilus sp.]|nr:hypothetical protein [Terracidiphilus sp.]
MDERTGNAIPGLTGWTLRQLRVGPRRLFGRWVERLPLDFRVLYKQFLLRILDLEALSIEVDMVEYLAQFAGILILVSFVQAVGALFAFQMQPEPPPPAVLWALGWQVEHGMVEKMLLIAGMVAVFLWEAPFPDRRDVMILGTLPVRPRTILAAKVASASAVLAMSVVCLNWATNFIWPVLLVGMRSPRVCFACWLAVFAVAIFLFALLLAAEGLGTILLPRRAFLRLSALGQLVAFALFPSAYFLLGQIDSPREILAAQNHWIVSCWPGYWFLALLRQVAGELPPEMNWLAWRAWSALAIAMVCAAVALIACYRRAIPRIAEQPDLEPTGKTSAWRIPFGGRLQTELIYFSLRTLVRSRQHRIVLAFAWALVLGLVLSVVSGLLQASGPQPVGEGLMIPTLLMMAMAVAGMRGVFALPIALKANWMLRLTQIRPTAKYMAATRSVLLLLAVLPIWLATALLSLGYRSLWSVAGHLLLLMIFGLLAIEASLIGFAKLPFTCSFLPGKANMQYVVWGGVLGAMLIMLFVHGTERPALTNAPYFAIIAALGLALVLALHLWNRARERDMQLYFEENPQQPIITLGLLINPNAKVQWNNESRSDSSTGL